MKATLDRLNTDRLKNRVALARTALNLGILYQLGVGGNNPKASRPDEGQGYCDCSGFALAWCMGISRKQVNGGKPWSQSIPWINTDAAIADARGKHQLFVPLVAPAVGSVVVYGKSDTESYGHCGVITAVQHDLDGNVTKLVGIDCHGGNRGHTVCAIEEHDLTYFLDKDIEFVVLREDLLD